MKMTSSNEENIFKEQNRLSVLFRPPDAAEHLPARFGTSTPIRAPFRIFLLAMREVSPAKGNNR